MLFAEASVLNNDACSGHLSVPNSGTEARTPTEPQEGPLLYSLFTIHRASIVLFSRLTSTSWHILPWRNDSLAKNFSYLLWYADDIARSTKFAPRLQLQLGWFHANTLQKAWHWIHTRPKSWLSPALPLRRDPINAQLESVLKFECLGTTWILSHSGRNTNASYKIVRHFAGAIPRA